MNALSGSKAEGFSRRRFLADTSALGVAAFLSVSEKAAAEPSPETKRLRLLHAPAICLAPQYLAEELLRLEGFTEIEYVNLGTRHGPSVVAAGDADLSMWDTPGTMPALDSGKVVVLGGVHAGCIEVFGNDRVKASS